MLLFYFYGIIYTRDFIINNRFKSNHQQANNKQNRRRAAITRADPQRGQPANSIEQYCCPNCNNLLSIGEQCSCNNPVNYGVLEYRKGQLICVGYTDKKGNIWRFRE